MIAVGEPEAIARRYNELNFGRTIHELSDEVSEDVERSRDRDAEIADAWFEDQQGARIIAIGFRESAVACMEVRFSEAVEDPIFGVTLRNDVGATVFATTTAFDEISTGRFAAGERIVVRLRFETWFTPTSYTLTPSIARAGMGSDALDLRPDLASIIVHGGHFTTGVVDVPHSFEIERR